ncbi:MAG: HAD-IA family hydrolase [Kangiellaceae bacterium]|jgi:phosphoglycolate phosphatase|nr:HAD-IA family hydrolase [Kangiellaceae bacterium]
MKYKAVLFDLDGTLADTAPDLAHALNELLTSQGKSPLPFETIRPYVSKGALGLIKLGFNIDENHQDYPRLRERYLAIYERAIYRDTKLFAGLEQLLNWCENNQIPWGIITNKPENLTRLLLSKMQLSERSSVTFCGDTFEFKKPHPYPLTEAAKSLKVVPEECIYVGDDERDMLAAKAAGITAVAANWGYIPPGDDSANWPADIWLDKSEDLALLIVDQHNV